MKASDYIADFFVQKEINVIFGYIGGMITHLVDSIDRNPEINFIQTYHEQTAAIAAEGYALESGKVGVAIATSGPGATNLMTGIADAYFGSVPTIFITGQVNTYEYKYNKPIRQQGFQETDVVSVVRPITKYAVLVDDADRLKYELEKAFHIASTGRKGPVLIDLPMDISRAEIDPDNMIEYISEEDSSSIDVDWTEIAKVIRTSKRPLFLLGGGCLGAGKELADIIKSFDVPFVTSLMGRGSVDETSDVYVGMIGSYGNRCANIVISQCDLLIALGTRLDTRQTGAKIDGFIPNGKIIHVDIDKNELSYHRLNNRINANCTVYSFIEYLQNNDIEFSPANKWKDWVKTITSKYNQEEEVKRFVENKAPYKFFEIFNKVSCNGAIITTDVGQNQMWAAQSVRLKNGQRFFTSGGLAPMGFSLPAAIGAAFASPEKTVYCFNGDGGFHMACQSLLLITQYGLNIKVIVMNNEALGMITQFQHLYFKDNMAGTVKEGGYLTPNIQGLAVAYKIPFKRLNVHNISEESMNEAFRNGPAIIEYKIKGLTTVAPKLEYDQPIYNPSPYLNELEVNGLIPDWNE